MREHHTLDPYPHPKDNGALFVNEPYLMDETLSEILPRKRDPEHKEDNIRVYIPLDINSEAVLRRLDRIVERYGAATEKNESEFCSEVNRLVAQIEIYDQIWYVRHMPMDGERSAEAKALVTQFVKRLEAIPDGCAESFPFDLIEELKKDYEITD